MPGEQEGKVAGLAMRMLIRAGDRGDNAAISQATEIIGDLPGSTQYLEHNLLETMSSNVYGATSPTHAQVIKQEILNMRERMGGCSLDMKGVIASTMALSYAGMMIAEERAERAERAEWAGPEEKERLARKSERAFNRYAKATGLALQLKKIMNAEYAERARRPAPKVEPAAESFEDDE